MRHIVLLLLATSLVSCAGDRTRGPSGPVGGTVIVAAAADANVLLPQLVRLTQDRFASELLFDPLVEIGTSLNTVGDADFQPRIARRWTWSADSLTITFELDPKARWHDGQSVTAADVVLGFDAIRLPINGSASAAELRDIASVTATDARHVAVRFTTRSAEQFYLTSVIFPLPSHLVTLDSAVALNTTPYAQAPVGSGPFKFVRWDRQARLEFAAVEDHYRGRPRLDRVVLTVSPEPATGLAKLWTGEADVWEAVPPPDVAEALRHEHVRLVTSPSFDYGYVAFNFRDPRHRDRPHALFTDAALRRAISMGVDRATIVRAVLDTMGYVARGPVGRAQYTADTTLRPLPFDRAAAAALLDSLGWTLGNARDGIRRKGTQRLTFAVLVPGSSRNRDRAAVLMQEQLRLLGVDMQIDRTENRIFTERRQGGQFDLVFGGWNTSPSPRGVIGSWGSNGHADGWGLNNDGRYTSAAFDAALERAVATTDPIAAKQHFREAYEIINNDAAAIFLYQSRPVAAVHRRLQMPAWRADGWWRSLAEWSVDPAQRLPRDARPTTTN